MTQKVFIFMAKESDGQFFVDRYFSEPVLFVQEILGIEPDEWQGEFLRNVHREQRIAISSGHGVGKTAATAWLVLWFISTRPHPQIVVTANTRAQLETKTWRELAKWLSKARNRKWFNMTATKLSMVEAEDTWFAAAIPWSENNSEAFAGTHEDHVLIVFDEASAIPDIIWDVCEGAMTTAGAKWVALGNPTKGSGRFFECFHHRKHRWGRMKVDSRTTKFTDKNQLSEWIEDYGISSDFVKVRILGEFPSLGEKQFIAAGVVDEAVKRSIEVPGGTPRLIGVDVARYGDDQTVIARRHGRKVEEFLRFRGLDTMEVAARVGALIDKERPDAVFVDGVGLGAGVVDRLNQLGYRPIEVQSGSRPDPENLETCYNKRAEMWWRLREWMYTADIPEDRELISDLTSIEYSYDAKMRIMMEKKSDMKSRGVLSPDSADALCLTFAFPTPPKAVYHRSDLMPEHFEDF